ncbi:MAG: VacJ family lipoprotein [Parvibaculum sp.]|nr:VacJ family lipoprotein [Parvibaculum sp.]
MADNRLRATRRQRLMGAVIAFAMLGGAPALAADADGENDPLEPMNRYFFELNIFFDTILLKPVATWYDGVVPRPGRDGIRNFLDNLRSPVILANDLLQGEWDRASTTASRFGINTTVGVLGLFDPASRWGMKQHSEDFGQTLAVWGTGEGPYLFLPVLGPAPPRDLTGFVVDQAFDPLTYIYWDRPKTVPVTRFVVNGVDQRARSLTTLDQIERTSVDYYATVRNLYRQSRANEIANGETDYDALPDIDYLTFDTNEPDTAGM